MSFIIKVYLKYKMLSQDIYFVSRTPLFNPHDLHYTGPHIPVGNPMRNHITTASRMQSDLLMKDSRISYFVHFNFFLVYFFYFFLEIIIICSNNRHRALVIGQFILPKTKQSSTRNLPNNNFFFFYFLEFRNCLNYFTFWEFYSLH